MWWTVVVGLDRRFEVFALFFFSVPFLSFSPKCRFFVISIELATNIPLTPGFSYFRLLLTSSIRPPLSPFALFNSVINSPID